VKLSSVRVHPGHVDYRSYTVIGSNEWNYICEIAESFYVAYNGEWKSPLGLTEVSIASYHGD